MKTPPLDHHHRGGLAVRVQSIWPDSGLFERLGGRPAVHRLIDVHYDRIENDPELFHIFRDVVSEERRRQKMFFEEWMGGEPLYSRHVSTHGTRLFHYIFPIRPADASRWLGHFHASLRSLDLPRDVVQEVLRGLGPMAKALVRPSVRGLPRRLRDARDDLPQVLAACLEDEPDLVQRHPPDFERLLFREAQAGRLDGVRYLLELGVDGNIPTWQDGIFVTPWCIAAAQGHWEVADLLLRHGAEVDIFSAAFLGDRQRVDELLTHHPPWLDAGDPASDHQGVPPICHAIQGGQFDLVREFLQRGVRVGPPAAHWVRRLVEAGEIELALEIVERGSDMSALGPGPWVQHGSLIEPLKARGADVNRPPAAWLSYCTHQVGRREDAELVAALLRQGADTAARQDGVTALHLAVRAGYAATVEVLLDGGCVVDAEDSVGNTPLGYLIFAHRRADRPALARRLLQAGADPNHGDAQGGSPLLRARRAKGQGARELLAILQAGESTEAC